MDEKLRLLYHRTGAATSASELDRAELSELYRHPAPTGGFVRTNFVATLDGAAAGPDGLSGSINTAADRDVFALLRAQADVIFVGAGTVRAEDYRAIDLAPWQWEVRRTLGLSEPPALAVLSHSLDIDPLITLADGPGRAGPVLVITDNPEAEAGSLQRNGIEVITVEGDDPATAAISRLAGRGLTRILCEGGAVLNRQLLAAGLVDDVCLTMAPTMIGGEMDRIVTGKLLGHGLSCRLEHCLLGRDDTMITRWTIPPRLSPPEQRPV